jgi:hypothetical protein
MERGKTTRNQKYVVIRYRELCERAARTCNNVYENDIHACKHSANDAGVCGDHC